MKSGGSNLHYCEGRWFSSSQMLQQWCTVLAKEGGTSLLGRGRELGGISERENCHEKL